FQGSSRK
ncbi:hypothetical protein VCHC62B1_1151B, partial [Vibrio cholerae HC-62B1]